MNAFKRTLVTCTALCTVSAIVSLTLPLPSLAIVDDREYYPHPASQYGGYSGGYRQVADERMSDYYGRQQGYPPPQNRRDPYNGGYSDDMTFQFPGMQPQRSYRSPRSGYMTPMPPNTAMEFTETMAEYPVYERNYAYPVPQDEMPVFRPYNTFETDRGIAFDRSQYPQDQYPQTYRAPTQPRFSPMPQEAFDGYYEYDQAPQQQGYSDQQGYDPRSGRPPQFDASRFYGGEDPRYQEQYFRDLERSRAGYQPPEPDDYLPTPEDTYRNSDYYRDEQMPDQQFGYSGGQPPMGAFDEYDQMQGNYQPRQAPGYAPAYPGGAGGYDAPPVAQRPFNPQYPGGAPAPQQSRGYGAYPYAPAVRPRFNAAPRLSSETMQILNSLPHKNARKKSPPIRRYGIDRFDRDVASEIEEETQDYDRAMKARDGKAGYDPEIELEKAYEALIAGQSQAAISIYNGIIKKAPRNQDALFGLATTYHRMGDLRAALPNYGKLLRINPEHREALNNFLVLVSEESEVEALRELERLERQNPDFSPIPAQLAIIYDSLGQPSMARKKMVRALRLEPDNVVYKYNLAIMLDKHGKSEDAATLYRELLSASRKGESLPASPENIEERLRYIASEGS
ncbi:MAG: tetratricopeptide repeat protein [Rickettsiales bacterium]|nr:tetratricopeptide repeat protein [Rickettsiales bacterium]